MYWNLKLQLIVSVEKFLDHKRRSAEIMTTTLANIEGPSVWDVISTEEISCSSHYIGKTLFSLNHHLSNS